MPEPLTLRDRKRAQTRERIIEAGVRLFTAKGYDETTVADIAAAADIGTRTFFGYFESKDALLFGSGGDRIALAVQTIAEASTDDDPARVLLRALDDAAQVDAADMVSEPAILRLRLVESVPAVRARAAAEQLAGVKAIGNALRSKFRHLDAARAAGLAGAFVGASTAALQTVLLEPSGGSPAARARRIHAAVAAGLGVKD
ncbi:TetR/AcrR family transcriptional regulator [Humibacter ginsengisoli]